MYFPNRLLFSLRTVDAFPNASRIGLESSILCSILFKLVASSVLQKKKHFSMTSGMVIYRFSRRGGQWRRVSLSVAGEQGFQLFTNPCFFWKLVVAIFSLFSGMWRERSKVHIPKCPRPLFLACCTWKYYFLWKLFGELDLRFRRHFQTARSFYKHDIFSPAQ